MSPEDASPEQLLIVGAGGFAREAVEAVRAVNAAHATWELLGFVDDDPSRHGSLIEGLRVLGPIEMVHRFERASVLVCTGRPDNYFSRKRIVGRLGLPPHRYATVVHPGADISPSTDLGSGTVVLAGVVTTASVRIDRHVAVMPGTVLTHDDHLADFATVASRVCLGGGVEVGEGAYLGAGALVREALSIGRWSLVGMGAVVTKDVPPHEVWAGLPARRIARAEVPPDVSAPTSG